MDLGNNKYEDCTTVINKAAKLIVTKQAQTHTVTLCSNFVYRAESLGHS